MHLTKGSNAAVTASAMLWSLTPAKIPDVSPGAFEHNGMVFAGSLLAALGSDGTISIWSAYGQRKASWPSVTERILAACWSPDSQRLLYASGQDLVIAALEAKAGEAQRAWRAHAKLILAVDWCAINDKIISGGEDCVYKVCPAVSIQYLLPAASLLTCKSGLAEGRSYQKNHGSSWTN